MAEPDREPASMPASSLPLDALCDEILVRHHASAHIAVPRIRGQLAALTEREPGAVPEHLAAVFAVVADLLLSHLAADWRQMPVPGDR